MDITCPACSTRYAVADSAVGAEGRGVRCAKCRHSWFQPPPESAELEAAATMPEPEPAPWPDPAPPPAAVAAPAIDQAAPWPSEASPPDAYDDASRTRDFAAAPSSFAYEPPFRPRRRRMSVWLIAAVLVVLAAVAIAVLAEFGIPDWLPVPRGALAEAKEALVGVPDLALDFPADRQRQRPLPNGGHFFNVSGTIRNTASARREVPTLRILLHDAHNNIVYSLETAPPKPSLAPGESETVDQAIIDAPASAHSATIGWKPR